PAIEGLDSKIPESELIASARDGDEDAFVELAQRYHARVWTTASRFARNRAELEDLVQDLFVKIWKGLPTFRNKSPFEHWLMRVTVRGCYDFLRKNRKRRESEVLTAEIFETISLIEAENDLLRQREASEIVGLLLEGLDPKDRTVITLLDLEEKSVRETAELTGWTESNVKVRAFRARKKMKLIFEKLGLER
ncbi:MAG: RNA polymerase sigma factor, partial [Verrucomicrobiales bacterium]|nr:RNA polymerase sigma factor [Verrucomicrobiales bacterium]